MKKTLALALAFVLVALSVAGCSKPATDNGTTPEPSNGGKSPTGS